MEKFKAVWLPAWYALDQKIERGMAAKFIFTGTEDERKFFNAMGNDEGMEGIYSKITRIHNSALGEVEVVDTYGLSYKIWLPGNDLLVMDAEQQPGQILSTTRKELQPGDVEFHVELERLLPSEIGALDMLPVMIDDDAPDFFKWAAQDYDDITDMGRYTGAMVHYLLPLMKNARANEMKIKPIMLLIDKVYNDEHPLLASIIDENVLHPLALKDEAQECINRFLSEPARERTLTHRERMKIARSTDL